MTLMMYTKQINDKLSDTRQQNFLFYKKKKKSTFSASGQSYILFNLC